MLGAYGDEVVKSPRIDRLAADGTTFLNAHCQQAVCGPSRASLLTGLRPDSTKVWDLKTKIRKVNAEVVTMPQHFKDNGYTSVGVGKIFDYRSVEGGHQTDDPVSWSRPYVVFPDSGKTEYGIANKAYVSMVRAKKAEMEKKGVKGYFELKKVLKTIPAYEGTEDVPDDTYDDGQIAKTGVGLIEELAPKDDPFFIAVGFKKPHLPFVAPKKYWDLYDRSKFKPHHLTERPKGSPHYHHQPGWELRNAYTGFAGLGEKEAVPDEEAITLIHGYHACVSYTDAQVGKLLDALEASGEADNTIVILWGDHGWHLGDHGMWCKHTNYEQSTRSPLIIVDGRAKKACGDKASVPVEFVDIFPTLCDLAGIPALEALEGVSLVPVLSDPEEVVKEVAVSQFHRTVSGRIVMGYAYRDKRYRLIEWEDNKFREGGIRGPVIDVELYDYVADPEETRNLAKDPAYKDVLEDMREMAERHNDKYRPVS
jgi:arylsulfatase A-like enzyme